MKLNDNRIKQAATLINQKRTNRKQARFANAVVRKCEYSTSAASKFDDAMLPLMKAKKEAEYVPVED